MAQSGYTPIQLYYSTTAAAVPVNTNLASGELALNIQDEKLYFKNAAGTVKLLASNATSAPVTSFTAGTTGFTPSTATTGAVTLAGTLATTNGGTGLTSFTSGGVVYASSTSALATGSALTFDGTTPTSSNATGSPNFIFNSNANTPYIGFAQSGASKFIIGASAIVASGAGYDFYGTAGIGFTFFTNAIRRLDITSAGDVGIGTSSPTSNLEVSGSTSSIVSKVTNTNTAGQAASQLVTNTAALYSAAFGSTAGGTTWAGLTGNSQTVIEAQASTSFVIGAFNNSAPIIFAQGRAEKIRISAAGGFSVGTTADPGAGAIYATGNITAYYSDARLKTVSGKIENALDKVAQLSGVYYTNNETAKSFGYDSDEVQVGVLAQDVEAVLPQIVKAAPFDLDENNNSKSGKNYKTVQYERLVPLLIEAINELQAKVKALEAK